MKFPYCADDSVSLQDPQYWDRNDKEELLVHFRNGSEVKNTNWTMNNVSSSLKENSDNRK